MKSIFTGWTVSALPSSFPLSTFLDCNRLSAGDLVKVGALDFHRLCGVVGVKGEQVDVSVTAFIAIHPAVPETANHTQ